MMPTMNRIGLLMIMLSAAPASAQLIAARTHAIAMGHHHVMVEDMEKNMSFWKSLGGETVTFSPADRKLAPTKGRALDHIGFEVDGLEALCKKLEAEGFTFESPYERIPERKIAHATLIDPWGTQIEFTEDLAGL